MSIPVRNNLDLGLNQLLSALVETVGSLPGTVTNGRVIYNTGDSKFYVGQGGVWVSFLITGTRLDQLAAPTGPVAMNAQKITGLADGTATTDAASWGQVQAMVNGLNWKDSCRVATTANLASLSGLLTIDGVTLNDGDRVLTKSQTSGTSRGIYIAHSGAWTRAPDLDTASEATAATVMIEEGTVNADTRWVQTQDITNLGSQSLVWVQMDQGGAAYTAGNGLSLSSNDFSVNVDNSSLEISADTLQVKALGIIGGMIADATINLTTKVTGILPIANGGTNANNAAGALANLGGVRKFSVDITGNGVLTSFTVNHAFATTDVHVQVWEASTNALVIVDTVRVDSNNVRIDFAQAVANAKVYRVVVMG